MRSKVGDIFTIPLDDERVGHGQKIHGRGVFFAAVYAGAHARERQPDLDAITAEPLAFFAETMDALLYHDDWVVIGNRPVDKAAFPWPAYQVATPDGIVVIDHEDFARPSTPEEAAALPLRTAVAPVRLEKALQALHGIGPWDPDYDQLRPVPPELQAAHLLRR